MGVYDPPIILGVISLTSFFLDLSIAGTLLPFFVDEVLHESSEWVGAALTAQYAGATAGLLLTGLVADHAGLRRTLAAACSANVILLNVQGWVRSTGALVVARAALGMTSTYALGLSWVAALAPRARLARWMAGAVVVAQGAVMVGGLIAGLMRGPDLALACGIVSVIPALVAGMLLAAREVELSPSPSASGGAAPPAIALRSSRQQRRDKRAALRRACGRAHLWALAFAPFVQGCFMGGIFTALTPQLLKTRHGWDEAQIARIFQLGGLCALLAHTSVTPYISSRTWVALGVQACGAHCGRLLPST